MTERILLPMAGVCPDPDYCIKMAGCMSGCTQGPGKEMSQGTPGLLGEPSSEGTVVPVPVEGSLQERPRELIVASVGSMALEV